MHQTLVQYQAHPLLADYMPYTHKSDAILKLLADLKPRLLATMHGSSFSGDCERAFADLRGVMRDVLGPPAETAAAD